MNRLLRSFVILALFLLTSQGVAGSHRKIDYTVDIQNCCKNTIKVLDIQFDGERIFLIEDGTTLVFLSSRSYEMPMIIPDLALITWKDSKGKFHEAKIPMSSLIHFKDYFGRKFRVEYNFCDDQLQVTFAKKKRRFEYDRKEIWTNDKTHPFKSEIIGLDE